MSRESDQTYFVNALREFLGLDPLAYTEASGEKSGRGPQVEAPDVITERGWQMSIDGCFKTPKRYS
jgi:hypothetical protein